MYFDKNTIYPLPEGATAGAVDAVENFAAEVIERFVMAGKRVSLPDVFHTLTEFLEAVKSVVGLTRSDVKALSLSLLEALFRHVDLPYIMEPFETVAETFFLQNLAPPMLDTLLKFWHAESPGLPE